MIYTIIVELDLMSFDRAKDILDRINYLDMDGVLKIRLVDEVQVR